MDAKSTRVAKNYFAVLEIWTRCCCSNLLPLWDNKKFQNQPFCLSSLLQNNQHIETLIALITCCNCQFQARLWKSKHTQCSKWQVLHSKGGVFSHLCSPHRWQGQEWFFNQLEMPDHTNFSFLVPFLILQPYAGERREHTIIL